MNERALRVLEYPKIIDRLVGFAGSEPGKKLCRELVPSSDLTQVRIMQTQTSDALSRILKSGSISFSGVGDLRMQLKRLEIGSSMSTVELLKTARLLDACARVKAWSHTDEETPEDSLAPLFARIEPLASLSREIRRCVLSEEEIADDASPALLKVRRSITAANDRIRSQLASLINGSARTYLQDAVITQRNGRFCVPVKAEHRSMVPGMIHDQSSSGSTLFVEPMSVVRLNNDIRELELQEKKEIEVILAKLSTQVDERSDYILTDIEVMTELDFIFSRAMLSKSYKGTEPVFNEDGVIDIRRGRHPLLDPKTVVPVDISLGDSFDLLVISGPNTGGKTVSLKTVGLLTMMGQAGLHIPAFDHSKLALFTEVFADIGDEQSIEQSLSTFSSHMTNIVSFWEQADEHSLVLFDELGAGTDPTEGAALAIAILSSLHRRGIRTIATTHYSELKVFALSTPGVENACCEFDVETLRPTYRLLIGVPGKSNAFAISSRLGLPDEVIDEAKEHISQEQESFEDVIADLEDRRRQAGAAQEQIEEDRQQIAQLRKRLEQKEAKLESSRDRIMKEAQEEAQAVLREAKEYADAVIRRYNKLGASPDMAREMERERTKLREKMTGLDTAGTPAASPAKGKGTDPKKLRLGDSVRVISMNLKGTVSSLPDAKGNLFVQMGILRSQVNVSDLELLEEDTSAGPKGRVSSGKIGMSKSASVSTEINLLGMTTDEAVVQLDKYLDDAYLAHLPSVRIVHGKGTGALRKAVHNYLRKQKHVDSFRLGEFGEGDAGVTIVTFKA